jgi:hypothetical protein
MLYYKTKVRIKEGFYRDMLGTLVRYDEINDTYCVQLGDNTQAYEKEDNLELL